jgi:tryptophanyl-tRNA synthetase
MRIVSGIQPTGSLHVGNYLGAIKNWISLQDKNESIFFIADLHSLTAPYEPKELQKKIMETVIAYLAAGIDPEKSILFAQSHVKEHTELCWLLNTVTPIGELQRMAQFKEKSKQFRSNINAGLLDYPVLMAADILIYKADAVPVGEDQVQHLEMARTVARKFNQKFGDILKEPKPILPKIGAKIMATDDPKKKMSKSSPQGCLFLFDEPETIREKIMSATTDSGREIKYNPAKKPGISNLLTIYSLLGDKTIKELEVEFQGKNYSEFKKSLADTMVSALEPFRRKRKEFSSRDIYIGEMLKQGALRARSIAQITMQEIRTAMGLI